jgi:hypothetical protein
MSVKKQRPPHSTYIIEELIEAGMFPEAMKMCDENEDFYNEKAEEMRDLFIKAKGKQIMVPINETIDGIAKLGLGLSIRK